MPVDLISVTSQWRHRDAASSLFPLMIAFVVLCAGSVHGEDILLQYKIKPGVEYRYKGTMECDPRPILKRIPRIEDAENERKTVFFELILKRGSVSTGMNYFDIATEMGTDRTTGKPFIVLDRRNVSRRIDFSAGKHRRGEKIFDEDAFEPILLRPWPAIVPNLPTYSRASWRTNQDCSFGALTSRLDNEEELFDRNFYAVLAESKQGVEHFDYKLCESTSQIARVEFTYSAETPTSQQIKTQFRASGKGEYVFDRTIGLVVKFTMEGDYVLSGQGTPISDRVKIEIEYQPNGAIQPTRKRSASRRKKSLSDSECDLWMGRFKSKSDIDRHDAMFAFFCHTATSAKSEQVVAMLRQSFESLSAGEKFWCASVIGSWGKQEDRAFLHELLKRKELATTLGAIEGLSNDPSEESAQAILALVDDRRYLNALAIALEKIGPAGEKNVQKCIQSQNPIICCNGCRILAKMGTAESIPDLVSLMDHVDENIVREAKTAVDEIKKRSRKKAQ